MDKKVTETNISETVLFSLKGAYYDIGKQKKITHESRSMIKKQSYSKNKVHVCVWRVKGMV